MYEKYICMSVYMHVVENVSIMYQSVDVDWIKCGLAFRRILYVRVRVEAVGVWTCGYAVQRTIRPVQETEERLYTYTPLWYSIGARSMGRGKGDGQWGGRE
ncbi:hypothetical protein HETIRDRAFT_442184 [Heterobasidion irregulare TC 32-1]|uniref:Uncharacterized protein n=1 Tax=Heterobasidion irregulare (strain TC 32-1) TaxID=747525 RepID=W4JQ37_HETIT|nr:uncharacterized protein HETIRDRAFT_442184 [Heterobasidion irregulare TC 32-1]ETW75648.1 hypothetical protein HETIRDRAFT_442184 [Heterobasidion irregulare TC 32-1]